MSFQKGVCLHYPTSSKYSDGYIYTYWPTWHDFNVFLYMILSQRIYLPTFYHQHQSNVGKFVPYLDHIWDWHTNANNCYFWLGKNAMAGMIWNDSIIDDTLLNCFEGANCLKTAQEKTTLPKKKTCRILIPRFRCLFMLFCINLKESIVYLPMCILWKLEPRSDFLQVNSCRWTLESCNGVPKILLWPY